jgi:rfaE bifunctional protein nucleotidyltransferase chain/domain
MPTMNASKRTAAITGASSGLGAAMAHAFAAAGFDLVLCGRDGARLDGVRDAMRARVTSRCELLPVDLTTAAGLGAFAEVLETHGVDTVVNNAAINPELVRRESASSLAEVGNVIAINTSAAIAVAQAGFKHFNIRGDGMIVNVNSVAGLRGSAHEPVYAASKFGLRGFSESVKDAWFARGVRMIDVYAGAIATGMSAGRSDIASLIDPEELAAFIVRICNTRSFVAREINIQKAPPASRHPKKVVFANGVFDLLHPGHMELLKFAKSIGDTLIVGLNSDRSVRLLKGPDRPIQDEQARKAVLENLRFVDEVVIFDELRTTEIVRRLMPDVVVKGDEYASEAVRATDMVPDSIEIVTFPVIRGTDGARLSTTAVIERRRKEQATAYSPDHPKSVVGSDIG